MSPAPPPGLDPSKWCTYDGCPVEICGGPHFVVTTDLGDEVIKEGQKPIGTPVSVMTEEQAQAHMEAEARAAGDGDNH